MRTNPGTPESAGAQLPGHPLERRQSVSRTSKEWHEGWCTCGEIHYRMRGYPLFIRCRDCHWVQREAGSAFVLNAMTEAGRMTILKDDVEIVYTPSASDSDRKSPDVPPVASLFGATILTASHRTSTSTRHHVCLGSRSHPICGQFPNAAIAIATGPMGALNGGARSRPRNLGNRRDRSRCFY